MAAAVRRRMVYQRLSIFNSHPQPSQWPWGGCQSRLLEGMVAGDMTSARQKIPSVMTADEFIAWPGDGVGGRYQLVDGELRR